MRNCDNTDGVSIKRGTTPTLQVYLDGVELSDVGSVTFLFKSCCSEDAPPLLEKTIETPDTNPVDVSLTLEDTYGLPNTEIWMDTRIVLQSGKIPPTEMVRIHVMDTLFREDWGAV